MSDDVNLPTAVNGDGWIVRECRERLIRPARAVIAHVMNTPIIADRRVEFLNVCHVFRAGRVDDQARTLVDVESIGGARPHRRCAGGFNGTPCSIRLAGAGEDLRWVDSLRYPRHGEGVVRWRNGKGGMICVACRIHLCEVASGSECVRSAVVRVGAVKNMVAVRPIADVQSAAWLHHSTDAAGSHIRRTAHRSAVCSKRDGRLERIRGCVKRIIFDLAVAQVDQHVDDRPAVVDRIHRKQTAGFVDGDRGGEVAGRVGEAGVVCAIHAQERGRILAGKQIEEITGSAHDLVRNHIRAARSHCEDGGSNRRAGCVRRGWRIS